MWFFVLFHILGFAQFINPGVKKLEVSGSGIERPPVKARKGRTAIVSVMTLSENLGQIKYKFYFTNFK